MPQRMLLAVACGVLLAIPALTAQPSAAQAPARPRPRPRRPSRRPWISSPGSPARGRARWATAPSSSTGARRSAAPSSRCIGASRRTSATLYELLAIEQEGEGVVLRIKHFAPGPGLVSREAKDESANNRLVSLEGRTAVFDGGDAANPVRITFNSPDSATLNIISERQRDGKPVATEFKYKRITP